MAPRPTRAPTGSQRPALLTPDRASGPSAPGAPRPPGSPAPPRPHAQPSWGGAVTRPPRVTLTSELTGAGRTRMDETRGRVRGAVGTEVGSSLVLGQPVYELDPKPRG